MNCAMLLVAETPIFCIGTYPVLNANRKTFAAKRRVNCWMWCGLHDQRSTNVLWK